MIHLHRGSPLPRPRHARARVRVCGLVCLRHPGPQNDPPSPSTHSPPLPPGASVWGPSLRPQGKHTAFFARARPPAGLPRAPCAPPIAVPPQVHHHVAIATLTTLLATQTSKFQEHVLKGLCERLHVPYRGANGRKFQRTLQGLVHRVLPSTVAAGKLGRGGSGPLPRPSPPVHEPLERHGGRVVPVQEVYQTDIYVPEDVELE